jgi:hypothetical protein
MKLRAITSFDGCVAASQEFDSAGEDNSGVGRHPAHDYSRENAPGGAYDLAQLKLVLEKSLDRIEILGSTAGGGDQMILRVDRAGGEDLNQIVVFGGTPDGTNNGKIVAANWTRHKGPVAIVVFGGTPNGTNNGKVLRADRIEIVVDIGVIEAND